MAGVRAGRFVIGIRHNGDICGCNSIREEACTEGNIRDAPLRELWTRPGAFAWNRERTRNSLTGFCRLCQYGDMCLGGCTGTRRTLGGSDGEYRYCAYRISVEGLFPKIDGMKDPRVLGARAEKAMELGLPEAAHRCLTRAVALDPGNARFAQRLAALTSRLTGTENIGDQRPPASLSPRDG